MNVKRSYLRRASFLQCVCLVTTCALAVGLAAAASAQTVLVDFGNNEPQYRGIPVPNPDPNGNTWNSIQPGLLVENMKDIDNVATTIDLGWNSPVGTDSYNGPAGPTDIPPLESNLPFTEIDAEALGNLGVLEAAFDYAASPLQEDTRALFDLQGLDPAKTYTLTFFGSHKYSNEAVTIYSVYSDSNYTQLLGSVELEVMDPANPFLHNQDKVAVISNLSVPVDTGILYVQFVGANSNLGYLNAMQIEASTPAGVVGDYNGDLTVNAADYTVWRDKFGSTSVLPNDPVGGTIGTTQYNNWKMNFGMTAGGGLGGVSAVPEPGSLLLCLLASVGALCLRSHR
jgi:hypothetical protein